MKPHEAHRDDEAFIYNARGALTGAAGTHASKFLPKSLISANGNIIVVARL